MRAAHWPGEALSQSRAARMRPGGTKPDGPFAVWRIDLCAVTPRPAGAKRPCAPKGAVHGSRAKPLAKPGPPFAARRHKARWPSAIGRTCFHAPIPRPAGAQRPAAPTGAAVHGLRAKPLGPQSGGAGAQPLPSCRRGRGGLGRGSCRRPWGRLRRGLRWCSCKGCSSPRPRF